MKLHKLLLTCAAVTLLTGPVVHSQPSASFNMVDSIGAATPLSREVADTSDAFRIDEYRLAWFSVAMDSRGVRSAGVDQNTVGKNYADDTLELIFDVSNDKINWTNVGGGAMIRILPTANDTSKNSIVITFEATNFRGVWGRFRFSYRDALTAAQRTDSLNIAQIKTIHAYMSGIK